LLDEPSPGLVPAVVERLYETLGRLHRQGPTLLLAQQSLELSLEIAGQAYVLQTGRTVLDGPAAELARDATVQRIYVELCGAGGGGARGSPRRAPASSAGRGWCVGRSEDPH
jgi:branched-chain amino acid transport system ATP-binding protein